MTRSVFSKEHSRNCHIAALQVFRQQASLLSLLSEVNSTCSLNLGEGSRGAAREKREGSGLDLFSLAHSPNPVLGRPTSPSADESAKSLSLLLGAEIIIRSQTGLLHGQQWGVADPDPPGLVRHG